MEKKYKLLVLTGPTAIGKTDISLDVARKINGEIISADSMQVYKYMDIGTSKIRSCEMDNIPHHMLDIVSPDEDFTVSNYKNRVTDHIKKINEDGKVPILVGGTGLYINSIVYHLKFTKVKSNEKLREEYNKLVNKHGSRYLHDKLYEVDPISAKRIHENDIQRIVRALEIFHETGKPMSSHNKNFREKNNQYNLSMFALNMDRKKLYSRINKRVNMMLDTGLIEEVQGLMDRGYNRKLVSMQGIGYKEIISYLEGEVGIDEAINTLKRNTRRYAKRQLTWFRRDSRINWINIDEFNNRDEIVDYIIKTFNN